MAQKPTLVPALTGADAWNESGNLLLETSPGLLIWPTTMIASMALSLVDNRIVRMMTLAICIILIIFLFYFFRNPTIDRSSYSRLGAYDMVSPTSGTVVQIDKVPMAQVEADYGPLVAF